MAEIAKDLALLDETHGLVVTLRNIHIAVDARNRMEALEHYLKRHNKTDEVTRELVQERLTLERGIGSVLKETVRAGNPQLSPGTTIRLPEGINRDQSSKWQRIASLPEDLFEKELAKPEPSTARLVMLARRLERTQRNAELAENAPGVSETVIPSPVLYVDPPWRYDYTRAENRAIENQYPTMTLDEICALEVPALPDAVLFLWATSPKLEDALSVITAWAFQYRTCMVWVKDKIGMGYYARQQHELLLIATKGQLPTPAPETRPSSVQEAPREKHSQKPVVFYELIEKMYPEFKDLWCEGFARRAREHWQRWGYEA